MVYDARDNFVVLFGGYSTLTLGDTWKFNGGIWTNITPTKSPSPRQLGSMAYDAKDKYVVLFGGKDGGSFDNDTWKFAAGVWTELTPSTPPPARYGASMAYDATDGYLVLFGGERTAGLAGAETWEFVGGQWTGITLTPSPAVREYASIDFDANDNYVVLFGGLGASSTILGDTWTFSAGVWTQLSLVLSPAPRYLSGMGYSVQDSEVFLFGGLTTGSSYLSDTWTFTGGNWTKISTTYTPSRRSEFAMADGGPSTHVVLFGGVSGAAVYLNDTWELHGLVWQHATPLSPAPRWGDAMTYDEADGYVLLFGGVPSQTLDMHLLGDTWKFANGIWTPLHPATSPSARSFSVMTYDQVDGYVLLFGGDSRTGLLNDTWSFVGGVWTNLTGASGPTPRDSSSMTFDAADNYVLLFGGAQTVSGNKLDSDTWKYAGGAWTLLSPANHPSARAAAEMVYDSEDGEVLLVSGKEVTAFFSDTWVYVAGSWTNVTPTLSSGPVFSIGGGLVDDTYDGYPLLFGGSGSLGAGQSTTWKFTGTAWTELSPVSNPGDLRSPGMAFDPPANEVVLMGGLGPLVVSGSTWTY